MTRFLPMLAFFAVACDPAELEAFEQGDLQLGTVSKTAGKTTSSLLPCWDAQGNPINTSQPHCRDQYEQIHGSASPNGGHDPYMTRIGGTTVYLARGFDGAALVGGRTVTTVRTGYLAADTSGMSLEVFAPAGVTTRVESRLGTAEVPSTVTAVVWGDFSDFVDRDGTTTNLVDGQPMSADGLTDVMMILDNGMSFIANGNQGAFTGVYEMEL